MLSKKLIIVFSAVFCCILAACSISGRLERAENYYRQGEYTKSADLYESVLKKKPDEVRALKGLADIKLILKDYNAVVDYYKKAVEIDPNSAAKDLATMVTYSDDNIRTKAAESIATLKNGSNEVIKEIIQQMQTANQYVKVDYLKALARIGRGASFVVQDILIYLDDPYTGVRQATLEALGNMTPARVKDSGGLAKMIEKMKDDDPLVVETAIKSIASLKTGASDMLPEVIKMTMSKNNRISAAARHAIPEISPGTKAAIPGLTQLLSPKYPVAVRILAIDSLALMGPEANDAVDDLIPLSQDANNEVKVAAVSALTKIGRPSNESVPDLIKLLKHKNVNIKLRAIAELAEMGKAASSALFSLDQLRRDPNKEVRAEAKKATEKILKAKR